MEIFLMIGAVAVIAVGAVAISRHVEKKRSDALEKVAADLNFSFTRKGDPSLLPRLERFHLFSQGRSRRVANTMRGSAGEIDVTITDYRYTTGSGKHAHTRRQTVLVFESSLLRLPAFALRPENVFHRIGAVVGYQDIDFDSHPRFSRQYLLRGADEDAIRAAFSDELLSYYEQSKNLSTEGDGDTLVFYRASKQVAPDDIRPFMEEGFAPFGLLKTT